MGKPHHVNVEPEGYCALRYVCATPATSTPLPKVLSLYTLDTLTINSDQMAHWIIAKGLKFDSLHVERILTGSLLADLSVQSTTLKSVNLTLAWIEDAEFAQITSTWKGLVSIELHSCCFRSACVSTLAHTCPNLRSLSLDNITDGNCIVDVIRSCCLESLTLTKCYVSNTVCTAMAEHCHNLRTLHLAALRNVGDIGLLAVAKNCPQLHCLNMDSMGITSAVVDTFFTHCPLLQSVTLSSGSIDDMEGRFVRSAAARLPHLRLFHLYVGAVQDKDIAALAVNCRELESLKIYKQYMEPVSDRTLKVLVRSCSKLKELTLCSSGRSISLHEAIEIARLDK